MAHCMLLAAATVLGMVAIVEANHLGRHHDPGAGQCCEEFSRFVSQNHASMENDAVLAFKQMDHEPFVKLYNTMKNRWRTFRVKEREDHTKLEKGTALMNENMIQEIHVNKLETTPPPSSTPVVFTTPTPVADKRTTRITTPKSWNVFLTKHYYQDEQGNWRAINFENVKPII